MTFSCYRRVPLLDTPEARRTFEVTLEQVRRWYGFCVIGYVVMPEHVHLLVSEPERASLTVAIQMLKQNVARKLRATMAEGRFWYARYYDHYLRNDQKRVEKLQYMHGNPVERGLCARPQDWVWSSFRHYASGVEGVVEIESEWTAQKRERLGFKLTLGPESPHPVSPRPARQGGYFRSGAASAGGRRRAPR